MKYLIALSILATIAAIVVAVLGMKISNWQAWVIWGLALVSYHTGRYVGIKGH